MNRLELSLLLCLYLLVPVLLTALCCVCGYVKQCCQQPVYMKEFCSPLTMHCDMSEGAGGMQEL